ncbi:hypothetical protein Cgig2_001299 [Carnegiea gigantea]|uniref:Uncharacterized protein n=1 Tax=Carnegiea gigantea TaxID=171969 RepID=A0A9Q1Q753_9CARY|nr:hypothetical protein Cgig2_001299 [Carnegiea gigantea]
MEVPLEHQVRYKFDTSLKVFDNITSLSESFNEKIKQPRYEPIFTMFGEMRKKFTSTITKRVNILIHTIREKKDLELSMDDASTIEKYKMAYDVTRQLWRSTTLRCSVCRKFEHYKRSHRGETNPFICEQERDEHESKILSKKRLRRRPFKEWRALVKK